MLSCCVTWQGTVLHCTVLYCIVLYCTVLYCTTLHYTVLSWQTTVFKAGLPPVEVWLELQEPCLAGMCRVWHDSRYHDLSLAIYPPHSIRGYPDNITLGNYPSECLCRLSIERHLLVFPLQCTHCTVLHCTVLHCTVLYCNVHTNSGGVNTRLHLALVHSWGADVSPKFDPNWIVQTWCPTFPHWQTVFAVKLFPRLNPCLTQCSRNRLCRHIVPSRV